MGWIAAGWGPMESRHRCQELEGDGCLARALDPNRGKQVTTTIGDIRNRRSNLVDYYWLPGLPGVMTAVPVAKCNDSTKYMWLRHEPNLHWLPELRVSLYGKAYVRGSKG